MMRENWLSFESFGAFTPMGVDREKVAVEERSALLKRGPLMSFLLFKGIVCCFHTLEPKINPVRDRI